MTNLVARPYYQPARKIDETLLDRIKRGYIRLIGEPGEIGDKQLCIMQATSYILGYDPGNYKPPCTSAVIRQQMIDINDSTGARKRNALKELIPDIINTAPMKITGSGRLVTDFQDLEYKHAERQRREILRKYTGNKQLYELPTSKIIEIIKELAAVAKFDTVVERPSPEA